MYTFNMLENYGSDYLKETDEEISLWIATSSSSVAFFREMGSLLEEIINAPKVNEFLEVVLPISIREMFATLNSVSIPQRQALTDDTLIDIYEPTEYDKKDGSKYVDISYYRLLDMSQNTI